MKIAYLVNQYPAPSHSFIRREILALEKLGHTVVRYSLRRYGGKLVDGDDQSETGRTQVVLAAGALRLLGALLGAFFGAPGRFFRAFGAMRALSRLSTRGGFAHLAYLAEACLLVSWLKREKPDHLHAHFGTNSTAVAMLVRLLGGPPYSFTIHGPTEFDSPAQLGLALKIRHAALVAAISSYGRGQVWRWCEIADQAKVQVVRCGVDELFLESTSAPPPAAPRLVCVGRLCAAKGQLLLLEAMGKLRDEGVAAELTLVGGGEMEAEVRRKVGALGLGDRVHLAGWMSAEQVRAELLNARALVLNSFAEGLPVVIMEAFACRRPVVSTYIAGIPELVEPGVSGWLSPAGDVDRLTAALREVLSASPEALYRMGQAGAEAVRERHSALTEAGRLAGYIEAAGAEGRPAA